MPTENRSSNTEMVSDLLPCPFCGQQDAFVEQLDSDASVVICQGRIDEYAACLARGPVGVQQHEGEDQPGRDQAVKEWNKRAAAQNHPEPIAWMVGTAIWWTKEEAERDAGATGLPVVGLGPMVDPVVADRLSTATAFVQQMVECAGTQQSVATGYVRDILDVLKGNATPSAPVELQRMNFEYVHAGGDRRTVALSREEVAGYMDEFLFERLTETLCQCEPIGETNVVDCHCDEVAEQFSLVKPS